MKFLDNFYSIKLRDRFKREFSHVYVVDKSALVDGRIPNFFKHFGFQHKVIIPGFVDDQLMEMSGSKNFLESSKGKRGLLAKKQLHKNLFELGQELQIYSFKSRAEIESNHSNLTHLVLDYKELIKQLVGVCIVITADSAFSKMLRIHNIGVINLNELAADLQDAVYIGEKYAVKLEAVGREEGQATGYINGKSLIVVQKASKYLNQTVPVVITNSIQNEHGKIYFGALQWEG